MRRNLAGLIAEGLVPYNVAERGQHLLSLRVVEDRVRLNGHDAGGEHARDAAYTAALIAALEEAIEKPWIGGKSRRVLRNILPLKEELLGKPVKERRTVAGREITQGHKVVKPGTIRTYYEPRALDSLAMALAELEAEYRGETSPNEAFGDATPVR